MGLNLTLANFGALFSWGGGRRGGGGGANVKCHSLFSYEYVCFDNCIITITAHYLTFSEIQPPPSRPVLKSESGLNIQDDYRASDHERLYCIGFSAPRPIIHFSGEGLKVEKEQVCQRHTETYMWTCSLGAVVERDGNVTCKMKSRVDDSWTSFCSECDSQEIWITGN